MAFEFTLPDLGENIESGDIVNILVEEGAEISAGTGVIEVETDKAVVEVPCPKAGRVTKIHVSKGDTIKVGEPIVTLEASSDSGDDKDSEKPAEKSAEKSAKAAEKPEKSAKKSAKKQAEPEEDLDDSADEAADADADDEVGVVAAPAEAESKRSGGKEPSARPGRATSVAEPEPEDDADEDSSAPAGPATRRLARELGVDLSQVSGSGSGGRITRDDVIASVRNMNQGGGAATAPRKSSAPRQTTPGRKDKDSHGPVTRDRLPKIRKTIATNMSRSWDIIPHVTNFDDADITELERIRKGSAADYDGTNVKLTMMSFIMKAVAHSLRQHPTMNASLDLENEEIIYKNYVNLGVAVDTDRGLVVPVVRDVDKLSIPQVANALTDLARRARAFEFKIEELRGGTFTISNLGAVGGTYSTPIINYPEVAVLLVGRARKVPVYQDDDRPVPRLMMPLSLSYDHRLVDGATAARFLNEVIGYLETPGRLLLAT